MFSRLQWLLLQISRQVWVRATAFSVLGIVTALIALVVKRYIPADLPAKIGSDAVDSLLTIIATSMLSVTIFSLSTMVSAYASATSNVTPRATRLLVEDTTAQNALATFIGSFLFSLVGIIVLKTGLYGDQGRVVLYVVTLLVIVLIVLMLLRWTDYVLRLGRVLPTSERVEEASSRAMKLRRDAPNLGGVARRDDADDHDVPKDAIPVFAERFGYVQHIDMRALQEAGESLDCSIHVDALPGRLVDTVLPLCFMTGSSITGDPINGSNPDSIIKDVRNAFTVTDARSFDQDPRFGMCVLSEIASRALSSAINDPGTAIDITARGTRVLAIWADPDNAQAADGNKVKFPRVHVPSLKLEELFDDFYTPIARDGAGIVEVGLHILKSLHALSRIGGGRYTSAAIHHAHQVVARSESAMTLADDIDRIRRAANRITT